MRRPLFFLLLALATPRPASPFGVGHIDYELSHCLWNFSFFDLVLEMDNVYIPFWRTHIANSVRVLNNKAAMEALGSCMDDSKRVLVVSPEGVDSLFLANKLADQGMGHVYVLRGGLDEWAVKGGATAGGPCCFPPGLSCLARSAYAGYAEQSWSTCQARSGGDYFLPYDGRVVEVVWGNALGSGGSWATSVDVAPHGRTLVVGGDMEKECSFGPGRAVASHGTQDAFVMLIDNHLGDILWAISIGGTLSDSATQVRMAPDGGVFVMGDFGGGGRLYFGGSDGKQHTEASSSDEDAFLARLDSQGNVRWARTLGGHGIDRAGGFALGRGCDGSEVATSCDGLIYAGGQYKGSLATGGVEIAALGGADIFIAQVDVAGNLVAQVRVGGNKQEDFGGITVDSKGDGLILAFTSPGANGAMSGLGGAGPQGSGWHLAQEECGQAGANGACMWVAGMAARNFSMTWSRSFGIECGANQRPCGINVSSITSDSNGHVVISGQFAGAALNWSDMRSSGLSDGFVVKLREVDGEVVWSNRIGGVGQNLVSSVALGPNGRLFATGEVHGNASVGRKPHKTLSSMTSWNSRFGGSVDPTTKNMFLGVFCPHSGNLQWITSSHEAVGNSQVGGVGLAAYKDGLTLLGNMDSLSVRMAGLKLGDVGSEKGHLAGTDTRQIIALSFLVPAATTGSPAAARVVVEKLTIGILMTFLACIGLWICRRWALELLLSKVRLGRRKSSRGKQTGRYGKVGKAGQSNGSDGIKMVLTSVLEEDEDCSDDASFVEENDILQCTSPGRFTDDSIARFRKDGVDADLGDIDPETPC